MYFNNVGHGTGFLSIPLCFIKKRKIESEAVSPWELNNTGLKDTQLSYAPLTNTTVMQIYGNVSKGVGE